MGLTFSATLESIVEVCLLAPQHNISIPSHFLQSIQKFSFELVDNTIKISLLKITTPHITDLQILRLDPGCPNDVFFTQPFLDFIKVRFFCNSCAQLQMIKDSSGDIHEVLAFSSSAKLSQEDPDLQLPLPFSFHQRNFLLSYLEPSFTTKPKSIYQYPYESSEEHYNRFTNDSDSLAARIPILRSHHEKGGPTASQIISAITSGVLSSDATPLSYLSSTSHPFFYILIAPFLQFLANNPPPSKFFLPLTHSYLVNSLT